MRRREPAVLDDDYDDFLEAADLGLRFDLAREDLAEEEDDLGFRTLYEDPDPIIRPPRWPHAA